MIYRGMATEIALPNPGLGVYTACNYLIGLQPPPLGRRSASMRFMNIPQTYYYGGDLTPKGPAYMAYAYHLGMSRQPHGSLGQWEPSQSHHSLSSSSRA